MQNRTGYTVLINTKNTTKKPFVSGALHVYERSSLRQILSEARGSMLLKMPSRQISILLAKLSPALKDFMLRRAAFFASHLFLAVKADIAFITVKGLGKLLLMLLKR